MVVDSISGNGFGFELGDFLFGEVENPLFHQRQNELVLNLIEAERDGNGRFGISGKPPVEDWRPRYGERATRYFRPRNEEVPERRAVGDWVIHRASC